MMVSSSMRFTKKVKRSCITKGFDQKDSIVVTHLLFIYCLSMVFAGLSNMTTMVMTTTLGPEFENVDRVLTKIDGINVLGKYISW